MNDETLVGALRVAIDLLEEEKGNLRKKVQWYQDNGTYRSYCIVQKLFGKKLKKLTVPLPEAK